MLFGKPLEAGRDVEEISICISSDQYGWDFLFEKVLDYLYYNPHLIFLLLTQMV